MSAHTWRLIDWFRDNQGRSATRLAINSNLGMDRLKLLEFANKTADIPHIEIYTSMEAIDAQAEYIRDGLDYAAWLANVQKLLDSPRIRAVHCMATINALCLATLPDLLTQLVNLKRIYGRERVSFTLNILRFPSFQSPLVLPDYLRRTFELNLTEWLRNHRRNSLLHEHELNHLRRLIDYLDVVKTPHSDAFEMPKLHNDVKQFFMQYDQRRNKNFVNTFPLLADWYNDLQV
jgi:hypothetical protein